MKIIKVFSVFLLMVLSSFNGFGQKATIYSTGNGGWMEPSSWNGGVVPTISDIVVIQVGHTISLDSGFPPFVPVETGDAAGVYVYGTLTVGGVLTSNYGVVVTGVGGNLTWANASSSCVVGGIEIQNGSTSSTFSQDINCHTTFTIKDGGKATIGGNVDCSASEVVVDGELFSTGNFSVDNDLTINDDGVITVVSGKTLYVGGDLDINNATTDKIVLYGSLAVDGNTNCEMTFPADRFSSFCPPMSNSTANQMMDPSGEDVFLTYWTPGANSSAAYNYITSLTTTLTNQGYMVWPNNNSGLTVDFSDKLRVASGTSFSYPISYGDGGSEDGYNFIGNPFPCHIDVGEFDFNNIYKGSVWVWNGSSFTTRSSITDPSDIAPFQGFFVQATGSGATVAFNSSAATSSSTQFLKTETVELDYRKLHIDIEGNGYAQEFYFFMAEDASFGHEDIYDVHSFFGLDVVPYLYTVPEDDPIPYNLFGIPELIDDEYQLPLTIQTGAQAEYSFSFTGMEDFDSDYSLFLYDNILDKKINLYDQNSYVFDLETGITSDRFVLIIEKDGVAVEDVEIEELGTIFAKNSDLFVSLEKYSGNGIISVFDMMGKCVVKSDVTSNQNIISMGDKKGCFVVNVVTDDGEMTKKVVIK